MVSQRLSSSQSSAFIFHWSPLIFIVQRDSEAKTFSSRASDCPAKLAKSKDGHIVGVLQGAPGSPGSGMFTWTEALLQAEAFCLMSWSSGSPH